MRGDSKTEVPITPVPEPTPDKEGADILCYRSGFEDGFHFACQKVGEGVAIGIIVYCFVKLGRLLVDA